MLAYLSLGTNLGDKLQNITTALELLNEQAGNIVRRSKNYQSPAWGFVSDNEFLNIAVAIQTNLQPLDLLAVTQQIEREMGRTHKSVNGQYTDRIIDIDILLYDNQNIQLPELIIPHPLIEQRDFVRIPLEEIIEKKTNS